VTGRRLRDGWRPCLAAFVTARIALSLVSLIAVGTIDPRPPVDVPGRPGPPAMPGWHNALDATERQDAIWFLRLGGGGGGGGGRVGGGGGARRSGSTIAHNSSETSRSTRVVMTASPARPTPRERNGV
jgi:hypothetical protein